MAGASSAIRMIPRTGLNELRRLDRIATEKGERMRPGLEVTGARY